MANNRIVKEKVVAFRLTEKQYEDFMKCFNDNIIVGVKSPGMLARKLALDMTHDRLTWRKKKEKLLAPEVYLATATPAAESALATA